MASVRFICGTQSQHRELEQELSRFLGTDDTILFSSCFDANGGVFETLLGAGGRGDLRRAQPRQHHRRHPAVEGAAVPLPQPGPGRPRDAAAGRRPPSARTVLVVTDGVFSMDGYYAPLEQICDLADRYGALVMVDDSHAVGFVGATGAGTPRAQRGHRPRRRRHRHAGQGAGRSVRRVRRAAGRRSSTCCGSAHGPTCSPTRSRRASWRAPAAALRLASDLGRGPRRPRAQRGHLPRRA